MGSDPLAKYRNSNNSDNSESSSTDNGSSSNSINSNADPLAKLRVLNDITSNTPSDTFHNNKPSDDIIYSSLHGTESNNNNVTPNNNLLSNIESGASNFIGRLGDMTKSFLGDNAQKPNSNINTNSNTKSIEDMVDNVFINNSTSQSPKIPFTNMTDYSSLLGKNQVANTVNPYAQNATITQYKPSLADNIKGGLNSAGEAVKSGLYSMGENLYGKEIENMVDDSIRKANGGRYLDDTNEGRVQNYFADNYNNLKNQGNTDKQINDLKNQQLAQAKAKDTVSQTQYNMGDPNYVPNTADKIASGIGGTLGIIGKYASMSEVLPEAPIVKNPIAQFIINRIRGGAVGGAVGAVDTYGNKQSMKELPGNVGRNALFMSVMGGTGDALQAGATKILPSVLAKYGLNDASKFGAGILDNGVARTIGKQLKTGVSMGLATASTMPTYSKDDPNKPTAKDVAINTVAGILLAGVPKAVSEAKIAIDSKGTFQPQYFKVPGIVDNTINQYNIQQINNGSAETNLKAHQDALINQGYTKIPLSNDTFYKPNSADGTASSIVFIGAKDGGFIKPLDNVLNSTIGKEQIGSFKLNDNADLSKGITVPNSDNISKESLDRVNSKIAQIGNNLYTVKVINPDFNIDTVLSNAHDEHMKSQGYVKDNSGVHTLTGKDGQLKDIKFPEVNGTPNYGTEVVDKPSGNNTQSAYDRGTLKGFLGNEEFPIKKIPTSNEFYNKAVDFYKKDDVVPSKSVNGYHIKATSDGEDVKISVMDTKGNVAGEHTEKVGDFLNSKDNIISAFSKNLPNNVVVKSIIQGIRAIPYGQQNNIDDKGSKYVTERNNIPIQVTADKLNVGDTLKLGVKDTLTLKNFKDAEVTNINGKTITIKNSDGETKNLNANAINKYLKGRGMGRLENRRFDIAGRELNNENVATNKEKQPAVAKQEVVTKQTPVKDEAREKAVSIIGEKDVKEFEAKGLKFASGGMDNFTYNKLNAKYGLHSVNNPLPELNDYVRLVKADEDNSANESTKEGTKPIEQTPDISKAETMKKKREDALKYKGVRERKEVTNTENQDNGYTHKVANTKEERHARIEARNKTNPHLTIEQIEGLSKDAKVSLSTGYSKDADFPKLESGYSILGSFKSKEGLHVHVQKGNKDFWTNENSIYPNNYVYKEAEEWKENSKPIESKEVKPKEEKKTPEKAKPNPKAKKEFDDNIKKLEESFARHNEIVTKGSDNYMFGSDGAGLYLVRNHVMINKDKLKKLHEKYGFELPEIYYKATPKEYPMDYMAKGFKSKPYSTDTYKDGHTKDKGKEYTDEELKAYQDKKEASENETGTKEVKKESSKEVENGNFQTDDGITKENIEKLSRNSILENYKNKLNLGLVSDEIKEKFKNKEPLPISRKMTLEEKTAILGYINSDNVANPFGKQDRIYTLKRLIENGILPEGILNKTMVGLQNREYIKANEIMPNSEVKYYGYLALNKENDKLYQNAIMSINSQTINAMLTNIGLSKQDIKLLSNVPLYDLYEYAINENRKQGEINNKKDQEEKRAKKEAENKLEQEEVIPYYENIVSKALEEKKPISDLADEYSDEYYKSEQYGEEFPASHYIVKAYHKLSSKFEAKEKDITEEKLNKQREEEKNKKDIENTNNLEKIAYENVKKRVDNLNEDAETLIQLKTDKKGIVKAKGDVEQGIRNLNHYAETGMYKDFIHTIFKLNDETIKSIKDAIVNGQRALSDDFKKEAETTNYKFPDIDLTMRKTKDTRDNKDLWVVGIDGKVNADLYRKVYLTLKNIGGSQYSRFTKGSNFYSDPTEKLKGIAPIEGNEIKEVKNKIPKADIKTETPKVETKTPTKAKYGKYGMSAYKKWGNNEIVNADLEKQDDPYTQAFTKYFEFYYNKGLNNVDKRNFLWQHPDLGDYHFQPHLEDKFYDAGKEDSSSKKAEVKPKVEKNNSTVQQTVQPNENIITTKDQQKEVDYLTNKLNNEGIPYEISKSTEYDAVNIKAIKDGDTKTFIIFNDGTPNYVRPNGNQKMFDMRNPDILKPNTKENISEKKPIEADADWYENGKVKDNKEFIKAMASGARARLKAKQEAKNASDEISATTMDNEDYDVTKNARFKRWFNGSKVVDDKGKPLVVYHGTGNADFTTFEYKNIDSLYGAGFYFTESPEIASSYTKAGTSRNVLRNSLANSEERKQYFKPENIVDSFGGKDKVISYFEGNKDKSWHVTVVEVDRNGKEIGRPRIHFTNPTKLEVYKYFGKSLDAKGILPLYLSIKNPIDVDTHKLADNELKELSFTKVAKEIENGKSYNFEQKKVTHHHEAYSKGNGVTLRDVYEYAKHNDPELFYDLDSNLQALGYDGITHIGGNYAGNKTNLHRVWIAFEPNQIKSATGNNGNFDPSVEDFTAATLDDSSPKPVLAHDDLLDYALVALEYMTDGYDTKEAVKKAMVDEFGDGIRLLMGGIYGQAEDMLNMTPKDLDQVMAMYNKKFEKVEVKSNKKETIAPKTITVNTEIPNNELTTEQLVQRIKTKGYERNASYGIYVKEMGLKPKIDAKKFYDIWDNVSANPHVKSEKVEFIPTHYDTLLKRNVQITVGDKATKLLWEDGHTGSEPNNLFNFERYLPINEKGGLTNGKTDASGKTADKPSNESNSPSNTGGGKSEVNAGASEQKRIDKVDKGNDNTSNHNVGKLPRTEPKEQSSTKDIHGESSIPPISETGNTGTSNSRTRSELEPTTSTNYRIDLAKQHYNSSPKQKFRNNVNAIELIHKLNTEGRIANDEEKEVLAKYEGWGSLRGAFDRYDKSWATEFKELNDLVTDGTITEEDYETLRSSSSTAYYTPPFVISEIYKAIKDFGFTNGYVLDPSMGTGNFFGMLPKEFSKSKLLGVELEHISGNISKYLYPGADVRITGYQLAKYPNNFIDLAVTNVPFETKHKITSDATIGKYGFSIQDYFFAKTVQYLKPNGIIGFITSSNTLDNRDNKLRKYLNDKVQFVGAIRLPQNAFSHTEAGVVTDIVFIRKLDEGEKAKNNGWNEIVDKNIEISGYTRNYGINEYFESHPQMVIGNYERDSRYGGLILRIADDVDLQKLLHSAIEKLPKNIIATKKEKVKEHILTDDTSLKDYAYVKKNGKVYQHLKGELTEVTTQSKKIEQMIDIKEAVNSLIDTMRKDLSEKEIKTAQKRLNVVYDNFVKTYGTLNDKKNISVFRDDPESDLILGLEYTDDDTGLLKKADIFTQRTIFPYKEITHVENSNEALLVSLDKYGKIDFDYMSNLSGISVEQIIQDLNNRETPVIFNDPQSGWVTASEYLSGNIIEKINQAKITNEIDKIYDKNISALEAIKPMPLSAEKINMKLGASWIPKEVIKDFISSLYDMGNNAKENLYVNYIESIGTWKINIGKIKMVDSGIELKYGVKDNTAMNIMEYALNMQHPVVKDHWVDTEGASHSQTNVQETEMARQKIGMIKNAFKDFVSNDDDRRTLLEEIYNLKYRNTVLPNFDGSFLTFPEANQSIAKILRKNQVDAIYRGIAGGNLLLAHEVGAGKTWIMQAIAMERIRLGLNKKALFAIPNNLVISGQFEREFRRLYPNAKILVAHKEDLVKESRRKFFGKIATGNWDAVIIPHSQIGMIPTGEEVINEYEAEEMAFIEDARLYADDRITQGALNSYEKNLKEKINKIRNKVGKDDVINFEQLGFDMLFVDEAHKFKNLPISTKLSTIKGVKTGDADRAIELYLKARYIAKLNNNKGGLIFATGTPVSNTMSEIYVFQRYLQYQTLVEHGILAYDAWASTFGEVTRKPELDKTGQNFVMVERFAKFVNIPELIQMFRQTADIVTIEDIKKWKNKDGKPAIVVPKMENDKPTVIVSEPSDDLIEYFSQLVERAKALEKVKKFLPGMDNPLNITNDAKLSSIDLRLVYPHEQAVNMEDDKQSKIYISANKIYKEWKDGTDKKLTQLVFLGAGTPKDFKTKIQKIKKADGTVREKVVIPRGVDLYTVLKNRLIELGIPKEEIVFLQDTNDTTRPELFRNINKGNVRVLIGSPQMMAEGMNVQNKLIAIHELDIPYTPTAIKQMEGRIIRNGNSNKTVRVYRYVIEKTYDAVAWGIISRKAGFIEQALNGDPNIRELEDLDSGFILNSKEIMAIATGNPLILKAFELDGKVKELTILQDGYKAQVYAAKRDVKFKRETFELISKRLKVLQRLQKIKNDNDNGDFSIEIDGKKYDKHKEAGEKLLKLISKSKLQDAINVDISVPNDNDYLTYFDDEKVKNNIKNISIKVGSIDGFDIRVIKLDVPQYESSETEEDGIIHVTKKQVGIVTAYQFYFADNNDIITRIRRLSDDPVSAINQIVNLVNGLDEQAKEVNERIESIQKDITGLEKQSVSTFPKEEEFKKATKELNDINKKLGMGEKEDSIESSFQDNGEEEGTAEDDDSEIPRQFRGDTSEVPFAQRKKKGAVGINVNRKRGSNNNKTKNPEQFEPSDPELLNVYKIGTETEQEKKNKFMDGLVDAYHSSTRIYKDIAHTAYNAEFINEIGSIAQVRKLAGDEVKKILDDIVKSLDRDMAHNFNWLVVLNDLAEEVKLKHILPGDIDPQAVLNALQEIQKYITPEIKEAIKLRNYYWKQIKENYIQHMEAIGVSVAHKFTKEDYFRHMIMENAEMQRFMAGIGNKLRPNTGRGFLKKREGSEKIYNMNYLEVEYQTMTEMLYDAKMAEKIKAIKDQYDISKELKGYADKHNKLAYEDIISSEKANTKVFDKKGNPISATENEYNKFGRNMAIGFSRLNTMALSGKLWDGNNHEYANVVAGIINNITVQNKVNDPKFMNYLSALAKDDTRLGAIPALTILGNIAKRRIFVENVLKANGLFKTFEDYIPKGSTKWQLIDGKMFITATTVNNRIGESLLNNIAQSAIISEKDINKALIVGGDRPSWVIKEEFANKLNDLYEKKKDDPEWVKLEQLLMRGWKQWCLTLNPLSFTKYNVRNFTSDVDASLIEPGVMKYVPQATRELYNRATKGIYTQNLLNWRDFGGFQDLTIPQEISDISRMRGFEDFNKDTGLKLYNPVKVLKNYRQLTSDLTNNREALLRYAAYLYYVQALKEGKIKYGASNPEIIRGLKTIEKKAFQLSNDLLGNYGEITETGRWIRKHVIPFYSWKEVNFKRYVRAIGNAVNLSVIEEELNNAYKYKTGYVGPPKKQPKIKILAKLIYNLIKVALSVMTFTALCYLEANLAFKGAESLLPTSVKDSPHFVLGKDKNGNIRTLNQVGSFMEFIKLFGLVPSDIQQVLKGSTSVLKELENVGSNVLNNTVSGLMPYISLLAGLGLGKNLYPDVLNPGNVRDKRQFAFQQFGLAPVGQKVLGLPQDSEVSPVDKALFYTNKPNETAYYNILDVKTQFLKANGKGGSSMSGSNTESSLDLYYYKQALRYGDVTMATKFKNLYYSTGGTDKGLSASINFVDPYNGLGTLKAKFISSLDTEQKGQLKMANQYFTDIKKENSNIRINAVSRRAGNLYLKNQKK